MPLSVEGGKGPNVSEPWTGEVLGFSKEIPGSFEESLRCRGGGEEAGRRKVAGSEILGLRPRAMSRRRPGAFLATGAATGPGRREAGASGSPPLFQPCLEAQGPKPKATVPKLFCTLRLQRVAIGRGLEIHFKLGAKRCSSTPPRQPRMLVQLKVALSLRAGLAGLRSRRACPDDLDLETP